MNKTERFDTSVCSSLQYMDLHKNACAHSSNPDQCREKMKTRCENNPLPSDTKLMNDLLGCYAQIGKNDPDKIQKKQECLHKFI